MSSTIFATGRAAREHVCQACGSAFVLSGATAELFGGWIATKCEDCAARPDPIEQTAPRTASTDTSGPAGEGIFVGGSCRPNPGAGAWAAVRVVGGAIVTEVAASRAFTTSMRLEIEGLLMGMRLALPRERVTVHTVSDLGVQTLKEWAPVWKRNGWRRGPKRGAIANLDLVREALDVYESRPNLTLAWAREGPARSWCEYAHDVAQARRGQAA